MRDHEYILNELIRMIASNIREVDHKLVVGRVNDMEDYQYKLGMRYALSIIQETINEMSKGE